MGKAVHVLRSCFHENDKRHDATANVAWSPSPCVQPDKRKTLQNLASRSARPSVSSSHRAIDLSIRTFVGEMGTGLLPVLHSSSAIVYSVECIARANITAGTEQHHQLATQSAVSKQFFSGVLSHQERVTT